MIFLVINGANLNALGVREPDVYGTKTQQDLFNMIGEKLNAEGDTAMFRFSNHEGGIIDSIQIALNDERIDGIIINPGAYAHYSYAIYDALKSVTHIPKVEVHISDISKREDFRMNLVTAKACDHYIYGHGFNGYLEAIDWIKARKSIDAYHE